MNKRHVLVAAAAIAGAALAAPAAHAQNGGLVYVQPVPQQSVQAVQARLRQDGDYAGGVDGMWGPDSQSALERFQQRHQLQVTGVLNEATAATLGLNPNTLLGPQVATVPAPVPAVTGDMLRPRAVAALQDRLRRLGYYDGAIDGTWGPQTQTAIQIFQQRTGLQVDGQPGPATVAALGLSPEVLSLR